MVHTCIPEKVKGKKIKWNNIKKRIIKKESVKIKRTTTTIQIASILFNSIWFFGVYFVKQRTVCFFWHPKVGFQNKRLFSTTSESWFLFESWMIYFKMRADSKQDGIKCEHVISPRPVFAVDKWEHDYIYTSASASQIWSWGGGGGRFGKLCISLEKSWLHACKVMCSNTNIHFIVLIFSLLAWESANKDCCCCWCWKVNLPHTV